MQCSHEGRLLNTTSLRSNVLVQDIIFRHYWQNENLYTKHLVAHKGQHFAVVKSKSTGCEQYVGGKEAERRELRYDRALKKEVAKHRRATTNKLLTNTKTRHFFTKTSFLVYVLGSFIQLIRKYVISGVNLNVIVLKLNKKILKQSEHKIRSNVKEQDWHGCKWCAYHQCILTKISTQHQMAHSIDNIERRRLE